MTLTAEQRYRQAEIKTRLEHERAIRAFMRGDIDIIDVCERANLIAEIERAYQAGLQDGRRA